MFLLALLMWDLVDLTQKVLGAHPRHGGRSYRLHTEDRENLHLIANHYFPGFTILRGQGYYNSTPEPAAVIEVYGTVEDRSEIEALARAIATVNEQSSVIVAEFGPNGIGVTEHGAAPERELADIIEFPVRRAA